MTYEKRKKRTNYRMMNRNKNGLPRLIIHRSNHNIYGQIILDSEHKVLAQSSTLSKDFIKNNTIKAYNIDGAKFVGSLLGKKAKDLNITKMCIDCNGYLYHGRVKAFIEAVMENIKE